MALHFGRGLIVPTILSLFSIGFGFESISSAQLTLEQQRAINKQREVEAENKRAAEAAKPQPTQFLKIANNESGEPATMQTAITRYRPEKGELVVDLIGAVHIGEGSYYQQLNRQFELYDVVLYELVAPQGTRIPKGGKKKSGGSLPSSPMDLVGWMQGQAQSQLGLESQLAMIDYQKQNFTHADLSPAQMSEKNGPNAVTLL